MDENNPFTPIGQLQDKHFDKLGYSLQYGFQGEPQFYRKDMRPMSQRTNIIEPPYLKGKGPKAQTLDKLFPAPKDPYVKPGTREYNRLIAELGKSAEYYKQKQTEAGVDWFLDNPITNAYLPATSVYPLVKNAVQGDIKGLGLEALASVPYIKAGNAVMRTGIRRRDEIRRALPNLTVGAAKLYDYVDFGQRTHKLKSQYDKK